MAPGVAFGRVHLVDRRKIKHPQHHVPPEHVDLELQRFKNAIDDARNSLRSFKERAPDHGAILDAHLLMMEDPLLLDRTERQIRDDRKCAEWALKSTIHEIRTSFDSIGDGYFRERRSDVDFVGERILAALVVTDPGIDDGVPADAIVVAHDLSPADTIALSRQKVRAFVTEVGGATSHTAILARSLDIPAVVGCAGLLQRVGSGDQLIVDGSAGDVVADATDDVIERYKDAAARRARVYGELIREANLPGKSVDGTPIALLANIEIPEEIPGALRASAEGVGLYRSEFLYLNRAELPNEHDHHEMCTAILDALGERPAVLRTFDIGSDKFAAAVRLPREHNPALGLRACRLGLARPDMFRAQLRGMIRATSAKRRGSILLPMIGSVEELLAVRELIDDEKNNLAREGVSVWDGIKVGVMIEVPAAVFLARELAEHADFFSVGTNDLIQYTLAIDRGNEQVARYWNPLHPAVIRALASVVAAAKERGIPVGMCGESASDPDFTPLALGMGFDSLSMPALALPRVRYVLRRLKAADCQTLAKDAAVASRADHISGLVADMLRAAVPDGLELLRDAAHN